MRAFARVTSDRAASEPWLATTAVVASILMPALGLAVQQRLGNLFPA
ncbi:MAG: hypothetical protein AAFY84_17810 [Pseudomonadota bacterium]